MDKKTRVAIIGTTIMIVILLVIIGMTIVKKLTPSKEVMPLTDYYQVKDNEVLVLLQDKIYEKKGILIDNIIYIDYDTIISEFNHRFYWDNNENILTYTLPDEILRAEADSNEYTVTKSMISNKASVDYPIVKIFADHVYIALDFVKQYSDMTFQYYAKPNRVVINYHWGDYLFTDVKKHTQLRKDASIKSPILMQLDAGTSLMYVDKEEAPKKGFSKVVTEDGIIGYVNNKSVKQSYYKTLKNDFKKPEYTSQTRNEKVNMVFHHVFNTDAVNNLEEMMQSTKEVNVIAPTWFEVNSEEGAFKSIASKEYVDKANSLGLEVWAVVSDFDTDISMLETLSRTSSRDNLSNALIEAALEYKLNGINIDFEHISEDAGVHYIQFLRELSVKCRNNGIILSIDDYVPAPYTEHYDRTEQGVIADYVVVMAYDEFYAGSDVAGPVSSIGFVKDGINNTLAEVPKEKTIIAIPFYTRLWKENAQKELTSEAFSMSKAFDILKENGVEPVWDEETGCYYAEFNKDGENYKIWLEEEKSVEEKLKAIYDADVAGIAAWKLGLEKDSIWDVIIKYLN